MNDKPYVPTQNLVDALKAHDSFDDFLTDHQTDLGIDLFRVALRRKFATNNESLALVINRSKLSPHYAYQIFNGTRTPSRDKIIQLGFGLRLNLEDINTLLNCANRQALYAKIARDSAIMYGLIHHYSLDETNNLLKSRNLVPLY
jgi:hypothetical protein